MSTESRLARLLETSQFARVVPHLAPDTLHQLIRYRGLDACSELVAAATPDQLTSVLDLDLWRSRQPGRDDQFDEERFAEWLELLVDADEEMAARIVAGIDENLVIAGLSRYVRVFDVAALGPATSGDDEPQDPARAPSSDLSREVGGYVLRATRTDGWDAIVGLLLALDADHHDYFHAVMRGCRRLSNSERELDGLDHLLMDHEQLLHDVAVDRERRRSQQGYSTPAEARAFLQMARHPQSQRRDASGPGNPLALAYFRAADELAAADERLPPHARASESLPSAEVAESIAAVVDLLAEAGLVPERSRALLQAATPQPSTISSLRRLMEYVQEANESIGLARTRELAFLANVLMAGCAVQSRPFTAQEAHDAAVAICNLGLEHWPAHWPNLGTQDVGSIAGAHTTLPRTLLVDHDLVTAFEVGWAVLHTDVSMFVAEQLIATLTDLECADDEMQSELRVLRRELRRQCDSGTPWRARDRLEVVALLDSTAWASLLGLLDECPVLPAALSAILEGRTRAVSATAFTFISTTDQIRQVRAFMKRLPGLLLG